MKNKGFVKLVIIILLVIQIFTSPALILRSKKLILSQTFAGVLGKQIVSSQHLPSELISCISSLGFLVMEPDRIQQLADKEGDFMYYRFNKIKFGFVKSTVELDYIWAISKSSNKAYLSGGGSTYNYYFILGRCFKFVRTRWIS